MSSSRWRRPIPPATRHGSTVPLLDAEPDLNRYLTAEQRIDASRVALPVHTVTRDSRDVDTLLATANAFGVLVLGGLLERRIRVDDHATLRLLGPGDLYLLGAEPQTSVLSECSCTATVGSTLALLDTPVMIATYRWPGLTVGLLRRVAEQAERIAVQLAIGHLPRVEQRVLAIIELLAEQWGCVTPDGTLVPLRLTHQTLGGLVGARRSTVTLALRTLTERGDLVKHANGWLLPPRDDTPAPTPHITRPST